MGIAWKLTIDCVSASALAEFWCAALGYVPAPAPEGWSTWEAWLIDNGVPEAEWDTGAAICDPDGAAPGISFLQVPEAKKVKNRVHLDIQIGGGRQHPWEERWPRVVSEAARLTSLGARVIEEKGDGDQPDHIVMADPEGNEFCLV